MPRSLSQFCCQSSTCKCQIALRCTEGENAKQYTQYGAVDLCLQSRGVHGSISTLKVGVLRDGDGSADERGTDERRGIDEEGDIDNAGEPQAFGVVVLEDVEDGVCGGEGRVLAPVAEVYKESKVPKGQYRSTSLLYGSRGYVFDLLNTRFHKIHAALEHPNRKLDLTRRLCGVLTTGNHVKSRFPRLIISK